jgi:DNA-binding transcriptional regulator GbsR (MarR family)
MERFILHWGEMGSAWGIPRAVSQIHALLYLAARPLNAEQISETLQLARSTVSTSLKELQGWHLARSSHVLGDRRDYFETHDDVWAMFRTVVDERKRREVDPTLAMLRETSAQLSEASQETPVTRKRIKAMLDFFETVNSAYEQSRDVPTEAVVTAIRGAGAMRRLFRPR